MSEQKYSEKLSVIKTHLYFRMMLCLFVSVVCVGCSSDDKGVETLEVSSESSNEAYNISKTIYEGVELAQVITEQYGADIYEAWRLSFQNSKDLNLDEFSSGLFLSQDEIEVGMFYYMLGDEYGRILEDGSNVERELLEESALYLPQLFRSESSIVAMWLALMSERCFTHMFRMEALLELNCILTQWKIC